MDNASYHTKVVDPVPSKYATKYVMRQYLEEHSMPYDSNLRKPEIFEIIQANASPTKKYRMDELIKQHGHSVLRLPPYHCDLKPIELAWAAVERFIRNRNVETELSLKTLEELTTHAIQSVSSDDWEKYCSHIEKLETKYWDTDGIVENVVETLNFTVESESGTDTASETGSMDWE
ncbi:uncharacterized protein LOC129222941 [Uloborus diversus]|uniref:uncharacterized protein LOC129222941 n=1 Tax=Uloborus diversus TaxID=327109 RepID=UPI00240A22E4|nr:uncharacterized protein LOC129222941 [Uloborus diversus]